MKIRHMKKSFLMVTLVACGILLMSGCSWFDKNAAPDATNTDISGKEMTKSPNIFSDEFKKTDVYDKPVVFSGAATRTDYFCSGGSCDTCENPGTLNITLNTDGTAKLSHVGQCLGYGIKGCSASEGSCEYTVTGSYSKAGSNIAFGKCDNKYSGTGSSKILPDSTTGSIRCEDKGEPMMIMEWNDLPKLK